MKKSKSVELAEVLSEKYIQSIFIGNSRRNFITWMKKEKGFEEFSSSQLRIIYELCDSVIQDSMDAEREKYEEIETHSEKDKSCGSCGCFHGKYSPCGSDDE